MQHQSLFVFDIETIPDTDAVPNLTRFNNPDVEARRAGLEQYHIKITDGRNSFPHQPFHKIVAISFWIPKSSTLMVKNLLLKEPTYG